MTHAALIEQIARAMCSRLHRLYGEAPWLDRERVSRDEFRAFARLAIRMYKKAERKKAKALEVK